MNSTHDSSRSTPAILYRKAYRWAWTNLRDPKFTPADVDTFNLSTIWAWVAIFTGLGMGLAVSFLVLLPYRFRFSPIIFFPLILCIVLAVGPVVVAGVIWLASMLKSINNRNHDAA